MAGNEDLEDNIDQINVNEIQENGIDNIEILEDLKNQNILLNKSNHVETDVKLIDLEDDIKDSNLNAVESTEKIVDNYDPDKKFESCIEINENNVKSNEELLDNHDVDSIESSCDENKENSEQPPLSRTKPIVHSPSEKPLCQKHTKSSNQLIKTDCDECFSLLSNQTTSISQIFGAMREWMPGSQKKMNVLVDEILRRGAHIDDMDGLEGNTMLHYACKSASEGIGSSDMAKQLVKDLIDKGANFKLRSRWTDMLPLHFAAYFNCPEILEVLLDASSNSDIDARCKEYDQGTALHMAASGLCYKAARFLIDRGSDPTLLNNKYKTPYECIAEGTKHELRQTPDSVEQLRALLKSAKSPVADEVLKDIGVSIGDDVQVEGGKTGTLKFCGKTQFASGVWCGVELHDKTGKNNGSVAGVTYFKAKPGFGMFAPPSKLSVLEKQRRPSQSSSSSDTAKLKVGDRVTVIGFKLGYIRFLGKVRFAGGVWVGVELDKPYGKCNGTKDGVKYFSCKPQNGVLVPIDKVKRSDAAGRSDKDSLMSPKIGRVTPSRSSPAAGNIFDTNRAPVCASPMRAASLASSTPTNTPSRGLPTSPAPRALPTSPAPRGLPTSPAPRGLPSSPAPRGLPTSPAPRGLPTSPAPRGLPSSPAPRGLPTSPAPRGLPTSPAPRGLPSSPAPRGLPPSSPASRRTPSSPAQAGLSSPTMRSRGLRSPGIARSNSGSSRGGSPSRGASSNETVYKKQIKLQPGMNAFVNGELGTVKYVGRVEFAEGIWVGVHLKNQNGKNDGTVQGKRYFSCKQGYGIMVRPSKVTIHGISASKLIDEKDYPE